MDWLPEWFHVSSEFVYALIAFLGSLAVVHYERRLARKDEERLLLLSQWAEIHSIGTRVFMPMQLAVRSRNIGDQQVNRESVVAITELRGQVVSLFFRALNDEVRRVAGDLDDICGHFLTQQRTISMDQLQTDLLDSVERIRSDSGIKMANIATKGAERSNKQMIEFLDRLKEEDLKKQSDILATSETGDTPPA